MKAGIFELQNGEAKELNLRDQAAEEWDCEPEDICVCLRCAALQPGYVMRKLADNKFCENCFDELS